MEEFLVRDRTEEINTDTHHPPGLLQQPLNQLRDKSTLRNTVKKP